MMGSVKLIMLVLVIFFASVNLLMTWFAFFRQRPPTTLAFWTIKVLVSALSPILFLLGLLTAGMGIVFDSWPAISIGGLCAILYFIHIIKITQAPDVSTGFDKVFGLQWEKNIPTERKDFFLSKRYVVRMPDSPGPIFIQNVSYYTIPETNRSLLCDIWQPGKNVKNSGLAFIYLHGSAWTVLDKDYGTRTFFRRMANQGHVIMDVAYRLFPETDFMGMVHDTKHAIAWMKKNAVVYGINPDSIVLGGGSAGAHIALLAAYTNQNNLFVPIDLSAVDTSVQAVISFYGQSDLAATYYHNGQHLITHSALGKKKKGETAGMPGWIQKSMGKNYHRLGFDKEEEPGMLAPILGGNPDEKPEAYSLYSPVTQVHQGCPPTLLIHGAHDILAPVNAIRHLYSRLIQENVPVVMHLLPLTDHAFDLILPKISPSAHNAMYDVERFLALQIYNGHEAKQKLNIKMSDERKPVVKVSV